MANRISSVFDEDSHNYSAIASHSLGSSRVDDKTVQQTPQPQAVSTALKRARPIHGQRLNELLSSFYQRLSSAGDQSSLGLLPQHILDFSVSSSSNSVNLAKRNSTECPKDSINRCEDVFEELDNVFEDGHNTSPCVERQDGDGKEAVIEKKGADDCYKSLTSSTDAELDFCTEQISARSSTTTDFYQRSASDVISRLFLRHSLNTSIVAESPVSDDDVDFGKALRSNEETGPAAAAEADDNNCQLIDTIFFHDLRHDSDSVAAADFSSAEKSFFVSGDAADELLMRDQEIFREEHELIVPNDLPPENAVRSSWLDDKKDITRPSWMSLGSGDRTSRVSIGAFMGARAHGLDSLSNIVKGPDPPSSKQPVSSQLNSSQHSLASVHEDSEDQSSNNSLISASAISMVMGDFSLSDDPMSLAAKVLKLAKTGCRPKLTADGQSLPARDAAAVVNPEVACRAEASGASFSEESDGQQAKRADSAGQQQQRACESNWTILRSSKKEDKDVQVSLWESPTSPHVPLSISVPKPFVSPCFPAIDGRIMPSSMPIVLHLLRSDSVGRRPSLDLPTSLVFAEPCCVGMTLESYLSVQNPTTQWLEGSMSLTSLTRDGRAWNLSDSVPPLVFAIDKCWTMEPSAAKRLKVTFTPPSSGKWVAHANIACRLKYVSSEAADWCPVSIVSLDGTAENPCIEVTPLDILDFEALPEECLSKRSVSISNKGKALVPIRLVIENATDPGQCFYFSNTSERTSPNANQIICSSVMTSVLKGQCGTSEAFSVHLKAPTIPKSDDDVLVLRTNLRIELDVPGSAVCVGSILLKALVGVLRLYTRQDIEPIPLQPNYDLPLQNRGPVPVHVEFSTRHPDTVFVSPPRVCLQPQQQASIHLSCQFKSAFTAPFNSVLQIKVQPDGPTFEIYVKGLLPVNPVAKPVGQPMLYSDHRSVYWGTVPLHRAVERTITLHNTSPVDVLHLSLSIIVGGAFSSDSPWRAPAGPPPFHLVVPSGADGVKFVQAMAASVQPMQKLPLALFYVPITAVWDCAVLVIKPNVPAQAGRSKIKFCIPLGGYGGVADVQWDGVIRAPSNVMRCDWHVENKASSGEFKLFARNCGERAAFVKIIPTLEPCSSPFPRDVMSSVSVYPSHFVLKEGTVQQVTFSCDDPSTAAPFYLGIFTGDEVLRQRFRLFVSRDPSSSSQQNDPLAQLLLGSRCLGEGPPPDERWPPGKPDCHIAMSNMKTCWVGVMPSVFASYDEEPSRIFRPLVPEQTFNETVSLAEQSMPLSPPTRERTPVLPIQLERSTLNFPPTKCGSSSVLKLTIRNLSRENEVVNITSPAMPFRVAHTAITVKQRHYLGLPVTFQPYQVGYFSSSIVLHLEENTSLSAQLIGEAI